MLFGQLRSSAVFGCHRYQSDVEKLKNSYTRKLKDIKSQGLLMRGGPSIGKWVGGWVHMSVYACPRHVIQMTNSVSDIILAIRKIRSLNYSAGSSNL